MPGAVHRPLPAGIEVRPTLARGRLRVPYKPLGRMRALKLHDRLVARALPRLAGPDRRRPHLAAWARCETLRTARRLGIPTVLERPNAHTRFAYEVVRDECERLGVALPADHEHAYNADDPARSRRRSTRSPTGCCARPTSSSQTFLDQGFADERLVRHLYGYDDALLPSAPAEPRPAGDGLTVLFVGVCAVRKGVHFALEAWLTSPASETGTFLIAGEFLPDYEARLAPHARPPERRGARAPRPTCPS